MAVQAMYATAAALKNARLSVKTHVVPGLGHSINLEAMVARMEAIQEALLVNTRP